MSQLTSPEMDKGQYQEIQAVIDQNPMVTGFDLYYLGFLSYHSSQLSLNNIFTHVRNIINLHNDGLITNEEKIECLLRIISKKIDLNVLKGLMPDSGDKDPEAETKRILGTYFSQILKLMPIYGCINKFELFYLGRFHAICPSQKITEIFQHINNIHSLVSEDLIDEEIQVDFLLRILNKKIKVNSGMETTLRIPQDQDIKPKASPNSTMIGAFNIKAEEGDNRSNKPVQRQELKTSPADKQLPQKDNNSKEKNLIGSTTEVAQKKTDDPISGQKDNKGGQGTGEGDKQKRASGSTQAQGIAGAEQKKSEKNTERTERAEGKQQSVLKEKNMQMQIESKKLTGDNREANLRNGSGEKKKVNGSKNNFMLTEEKQTGRMEVEEQKRMEEERTSGDSDSSYNASTSISSGDNKATKRSTGKFLVRATPIETAAETPSGGAVNSLASRPARQVNKDSEEELEGEFGKDNLKARAKANKEGLQELIRRARKSLQSEPVEKLLMPEQVTDLMLPPLPSVRESQASMLSDKPLIVQWKKRRVIVGLERNNQLSYKETQESNEEESSKDVSASPESSYVDEDSMDRIVELGKRANFRDTKDSKKKFKANPSLEDNGSEFEEEVPLRGNRKILQEERKARDFEEEKPVQKGSLKEKLVNNRDTGKMVVEKKTSNSNATSVSTMKRGPEDNVKKVATPSKGVPSESLKQQIKMNKDEERARQANEKQNAAQVKGPEKKHAAKSGK